MKEFEIEVDTTVGNCHMQLAKPDSIDREYTIKNKGFGFVYIEGQLLPLHPDEEITVIAFDDTPNKRYTTLKWRLSSYKRNN